MIPLSSYGPNMEISGYGICWACSTAMVINHKNGSTISGAYLYTELLSSAYYLDWFTAYGPICGSIPWVKQAYQIHGISIIDAAAPLTYTQNYSLLSSSKPIHYDMYMSGTTTGHAVVLCGSYYDNTRLIYYFADPNEYNVSSGEDNAVTVSVLQNMSAYSNASMIKFVTSGGDVYDLCTHTYHY